MIEHVREPWRTAYRINPLTEMYAQEVFDADGETIASLSWYPVKKNDHTTTTNREANARRIVACVNACATWTTEHLEGMDLPQEFGKAAGMIGSLTIDNDRLKKRCDEGTRILRMFEDWWRLPNEQRTIENIEPAMRSAIEALYAEDGQ